MCLKGQCDGYLSQDPCYSRRTVRSKVISYILVHSFGLEPKSPLSQSLHANHSGGELPLGVWIGVALTFGWLLGLAKIGHPPLHRLARHIHSRVSCKGTRWGKTIFYRIFISICVQASATASHTARWRRRASLRRRYAKSITRIPTTR